jgi:pilus assembly protein CpaF
MENGTMQVQLLIDDGRRTETRVLRGDVLTIGRAPECDVQLDHDRVSRHHVTLRLQQSILRVEDRSRNGTLAGSEWVSQREVDVPWSTRLTIAHYVLSLVPRGPAAAALDDISPAQAVVAVASGSEPNPGAALEVADVAPGSGPRPVQATPPPPQRSPAPAAAPPPLLEASPAEEREKLLGVRREIHRRLLEHLDLAAIDPGKLDSPSLRGQVLPALRRIVATLDASIPADINRDALVGEMLDEALGLGPLEQLLCDPTISEIMVVDPDTIYIEQRGKLTRSGARFTDDERVRAVIERIVTPLGRRIDESSPLVDARLADGSRVNAVIRPLALRGSAITIRKFSKKPLSMGDLVGFGAMTEAMARFLTRSVIAKKNIVIAGGTGSGKTTLLNVLSAAIPREERVVTIEDAAELQLGQPHVVALETRPANMEGKGEYSIRDLVKNALRMRPDRIVVGECRGGEALDMLQAMNTGHDGSLTTTHANSPREAIARLETLVLMAGLELPVRAIREQIAGAVNLLVQQSRLSDGSRRVTAISEVTGIDAEGSVQLVPIFCFVKSGIGPAGEVQGEFQATGFLPTYLDELVLTGLVKPGERFL